MGVKMLTEKAGNLRGMGADAIARQAYGLGARFYTNEETGDAYPDYAGIIATQSATGFDVLDYVVEVHEG